MADDNQEERHPNPWGAAALEALRRHQARKQAESQRVRETLERAAAARHGDQTTTDDQRRDGQA